MQDISHCTRCLYPSTHPLGLTFDDEGVCSGCRVHEEKDRLDWDDRWLKLETLVKPYRSRSGEEYDCIVPVTGANDSYYIVHLVKNKLRLNPLLVTYNKYFNTELGVANLANLRIRFDCDILIQNIDPRSVRRITQTTLRTMGSIYWHCLAGQTVFPVQTAVRMKIPLIIWGAHQGVEQVGMFSHEHEVEMTRRYRTDHDLMQLEADDLLTTFDVIKEEDVWQYRYPEFSDLRSTGVRGIYLGNYVRWDPKQQHEEMIEKFGYRSARFARTFDTYDHVDCYNFLDLHDELKLAKHGYSKVTDHACREIRHGRLSRDDATFLVSTHERAPMQFTNLFCDWLGVTPKSLPFLVNAHRNRRFWTETKPGIWEMKTASSASSRAASDSLPRFRATDQLDRGKGARYVTIGRGYP